MSATPQRQHWNSQAETRFAVSALACWLAMPVSAAQAPTPPVFRAEADLVTIDLQVTAKNGGSVPPLTNERFDVRIDGRKRRLLFATLLHDDDGGVVRGLTAAGLDAAVGALCIFQNLRVRDMPHAHYRIGIDTTDADQRRVEKVRVRTTAKDLVVVRWAWRRSGGPQ
jgi:hypothetical protein